MRFIRLQTVVAICTSSDGDPQVKQKVLQSLCKADPVIKEVLKMYGEDVLA